MLGSVTLVRVKSALVSAIWIGDRYMIDEIVYEYDRKYSQQLVYVAISRVIFNTYQRGMRNAFGSHPQ